MQKRTVLYADEGKVITNGEIYGTTIFLAEGMEVEEFTEISKEEYEEKLKADGDEIM